MLDETSFPDDVVGAAAASQATLGEKISALRALSEPFPDARAPAVAERWIADGARTSQVVPEDPTHGSRIR